MRGFPVVVDFVAVMDWGVEGGDGVDCGSEVEEGEGVEDVGAFWGAEGASAGGQALERLRLLGCW